MRVQDLDVIVVGAGFAGMYLLHRLRGLGLNTLVVEAGTGVGGTWYWNRYPGARCDVESMQYSYQFDDALQQEWEWSERYSPQPEILRYAEHVADRYDLLRDIRFNTRVCSAVFDELQKRWTLTAEDGKQFSSRYFIMATGCLSVPNWPDIAGRDKFKGRVLHTALWPHEDVDFKRQRVAIIGTGSSAIQTIPVIAEQVEKLYVFQRTANYSIPAHNAASDPNSVSAIKLDYQSLRNEARKNFSGIHGVYNKVSALEVSPEERTAEYEQRWQTGGLTFGGAFGDLMQSKAANDTAAEFVREKIRSTVKDPEVARLLSPENIFGVKRVCVDSNYFSTYNLEHVTLVDLNASPVTEIRENGISTQNHCVEVDMIIIATGFDAMTGALNNVDIRGRGDVSLKSLWSEGPSSYLGLAMADFPNLFTVTGPGSPSVFTNMLPTIEQHVEWISECINYTQSNGYQLIEARHDAEQQWWAHCQEVANAGLKTTTDSWYMGANVSGKARVFMPYFGGFPAYCQKCQEVASNNYDGFSFQ